MVWCLLWAAGCATTPPAEEQIWRNIKLAEIAPPPGDRPDPPKFLGTVNMEIHVMELPADSVDQLDNIWQILSAKPIRMTSYNAFSYNSFRVRAGRTEIWKRIEELLVAADAQKVSTMSLIVPDNDTTDFAIVDLPVGRQIAFIGSNLMRQTANVGPGVLMLRLRAEPIPWARGVRKIIAYPVHTLPLTSTIQQLQERARRREFYFAPAAFALQMGPGDLVILGPDQYSGERTSLGGLFFNRPEGVLFFNPSKRKAPAHKPAVRLYVLVCTGVSG